MARIKRPLAFVATRRADVESARQGQFADCRLSLLRFERLHQAADRALRVALNDCFAAADIFQLSLEEFEHVRRRFEHVGLGEFLCIGVEHLLPLLEQLGFGRLQCDFNQRGQVCDLLGAPGFACSHDRAKDFRGDNSTRSDLAQFGERRWRLWLPTWLPLALVSAENFAATFATFSARNRARSVFQYIEALAPAPSGGPAHAQPVSGGLLRCLPQAHGLA